MLKDTNEEQDEELCRVKSGRFLNARASVSLKLGCVNDLEAI